MRRHAAYDKEVPVGGEDRGGGSGGGGLGEEAQVHTEEAYQWRALLLPCLTLMFKKKAPTTKRD